MTRSELLLEALKVVASMAVPYIALLRTRADLDRFAAAQRAKEGVPLELAMRRRWYHPLFISRKRR